MFTDLTGYTMNILVSFFLISETLNLITEGVCFKLCELKLWDGQHNITQHLDQQDPFQIAKTVAPLNGILLSMSTTCRLKKSYKSEEYSTKELIPDCLTHGNVQNSLIEHLVLNISSQRVFDHVYYDGTFPFQLKEGLRNILQELEGMSMIYMSSLTLEGDFLPLTSTKLILNIDDALRSNDTLEDIYSQTDTKVLNFVIVCSVECILDILHQAYLHETKYFRTSRWVLIPSECACATNFTYHPANIPSADILIVDSENCIDKLSNDSCLTIYKLESVRQLELRQVGRIGENGNITLMEKLFTGSKNNLNGRKLTVATLEWIPFVFKRIVNETITYEGVCMDLLAELSRVLNFTYTIVEPEDGSWGEEVNGSWTGLIGLLADSKVDLVAAPISAVLSRERVMDFTLPYFYQRSGIILKGPNSNSNKWLTLVSPFRYEIHICILFSLILSAVVLFLVEELYPGNIWTDNRLSARRTRYGDILWYHFGALLANGGSYLPNTVSGRTILSCWWLFTVISAATYSGNLIAFLTDWREKIPFNSLAELVEQDTYSWGTLGGTVLTSVFKDSKREDYQRTWDGMQSPNLLSKDIDDHKKMLDDSLYAYLGDEDIYSAWRSQDCEVHMIEDAYHESFYSFGLQNNSIYKSIFSSMILRIYELGLPEIWYKKWNPHVQCGTDKSAKRVDILGLQSIFYAAGIGIVLASIVLSFEVIYKRACQRHGVPNEDVTVRRHSCGNDS